MVHNVIKVYSGACKKKVDRNDRSETVGDAR